MLRFFPWVVLLRVETIFIPTELSSSSLAGKFFSCLSRAGFIMLDGSSITLLEDTMPVVHIYMYAGRSKEQKSEMVRRISKTSKKS